MAAVKQVHYPLLESAIGMAADFLARAVRRHKAAQELRNLGTHEAFTIAKDLGVSQTELRSLVTHEPSDPNRLKRMLSALKLDGRNLQKTNPTLVRDIQRVCAFCNNTRQCDRELRAGSAGNHFQIYCPNSANFESANH